MRKGCPHGVARGYGNKWGWKSQWEETPLKGMFDIPPKEKYLS